MQSAITPLDRLNAEGHGLAGVGNKCRWPRAIDVLPRFSRRRVELTARAGVEALPACREVPAIEQGGSARSRRAPPFLLPPARSLPGRRFFFELLDAAALAADAKSSLKASAGYFRKEFGCHELQ
jgi:hypothetical protein